MRLAFIDLETIGLPRQPSFDVYYHYTQLKYYDSARIVQIALIIYEIDEKAMSTTEAKLISEHMQIVKPDGFDIKNEHIHRISDKVANFVGIPFTEVIDKIMPDLLTCDVLIAHNILFDKNVLLSELYRYSMTEAIDKVTDMKSFCTSRGCAGITKLRYTIFGFKQPKLSELYKFLFKKDMSGAHDAYSDTKSLAACFLELLKRNLIVYADGKFKAST